MSDSITTSKTLTLEELTVLMSFHHTRSQWGQEDTAKVSIEYDHQYKDFLITTNEKNVRKGRFSKLQAEITAWAEGQIKALHYANKNVNAFVLTFADDVLSIKLEFESESVDITGDEQLDTEA